MNGIVEVAVVHNPYEEADHTDDLGQELTELVELLLKRCVLFFLRCLLNFILDSTNCSFHSSIDYYTDSATIVNDCRRKKHILLVW